MDWKMPDLGEGVQEGEIVKWLVQPGDKISTDQHLVEIMTDKATMEIPSPTDGTLEKILVKEGAVAKVGQPMAVITTGSAESKQPVQKTEVKSAPLKSVVTAPVRNVQNVITESGAKTLAPPSVRQAARDMNVDLGKVRGTGPGGRITKTDLQTLQTKRQEFRDPSREEVIPLRGLRRKIAEHMVLSRKTVAHFTHVDEADFTELMALREASKKTAEAKGVKLTFLPFIIKAVIKGLKKYPTLNASLDDAAHEIILKKYFNIGVAVATEEGLIVPVVKNADQLDVFALAGEISRLSEAARARKIALEDLKEGTFTVTNIGSIGGVFSAPIVNYPEVAIMGLHKIKPTPVVRDGAIVIRNMMYISISADHRVVDGAEVAAFLRDVISYIEHPAEELL